MRAYKVQELMSAHNYQQSLAVLKEVVLAHPDTEEEILKAISNIAKPGEWVDHYDTVNYWVAQKGYRFLLESMDPSVVLRILKYEREEVK